MLKWKFWDVHQEIRCQIFLFLFKMHGASDSLYNKHSIAENKFLQRVPNQSIYLFIRQRNLIYFWKFSQLLRKELSASKLTLKPQNNNNKQALRYKEREETFALTRWKAISIYTMQKFLMIGTAADSEYNFHKSDKGRPIWGWSFTLLFTWLKISSTCQKHKSTIMKNSPNRFTKLHQRGWNRPCKTVVHVRKLKCNTILLCQTKVTQ